MFQDVYDSLQRKLVQNFTKNLLACILFVRIVTRLNRFLYPLFSANDKDRCQATCFCWQPNNQILIACTGGMLISFDCETQNVSILHNKGYSSKAIFTF